MKSFSLLPRLAKPRLSSEQISLILVRYWQDKPSDPVTFPHNMHDNLKENPTKLFKMQIKVDKGQSLEMLMQNGNAKELGVSEQHLHSAKAAPVRANQLLLAEECRGSMEHPPETAGLCTPLQGDNGEATPQEHGVCPDCWLHIRQIMGRYQV
ncbi:hypothetical protein DUI87_10527 [Hirundo rustica rustica]|uniref:Uncharacterized protein n=1 Tax=Hirundo rustica rustica TaxID=333673 RepID=A0A3M0KIC5_HIRRU|nr:hypothetical protein DUI87_10527 [Hirundo rustica rustica]